MLRLLRVLNRASGCLLVLEDLHWVDADTLAVVEYLADNLAPEPVALVMTLRAEQSDATPNLCFGGTRQGRPSFTCPI